MKRNGAEPLSLETMNDYVENILAENLTLKRKLESKCQAVKILNYEVEKLKVDVERQKEIISKMKSSERESCNNLDQETSPSDSTRALRLEIEHLRQKLRDALGDVQVLRNQRSCESPPNPGDKQKNSFCNEELVERLEVLQIEKAKLECDKQTLIDEKEELINERDAYKCKLHRLNHQFNVFLKGDTNNLIDLDALIMENRLLQERLLQSKEECQLAKQVSERYKNLVISKKTNDGLLMTQKQVKELLTNAGIGDESPELRSQCLALLDSLGDKTLALSHQKRANRILAARIAQLQSRLESKCSTRFVESPSKLLLEGYKEPEGEQ